MTRARARAVEEEVVPTSDIKVGTPPAKRGGKFDWPEIAVKLRKKPGKWHQIFEQDRYTYVTSLRQGSVRVLAKANGFEVRTANNTYVDGVRVSDLWLRYVPEQDTTRGTKK